MMVFKDNLEEEGMSPIKGYEVKIIDFGLATVASKFRKMKDMCGTLD